MELTEQESGFELPHLGAFERTAFAFAGEAAGLRGATDEEFCFPGFHVP
jgi:hypothetical protein